MARKGASLKRTDLMPLIIGLIAGLTISGLMWHRVITQPREVIVQGSQIQTGIASAVASASLVTDHNQPANSEAVSTHQQARQLEGTHGSKQVDKLGMVIATGANAQYFQGLQNMVGSVHYWCQECSIVVYNLGLTAEQVDEVGKWCRTRIRWNNGIAVNGTASGHVKQPKQYAWKPFAILETVDEHKGRDVVLWIDAGSTITGPLMNSLYPLLVKDGHLLMQGQDLDMTRLLHPAVWDYFQYNKTDFVNKPSYSGNTMGFVYGSQAYHDILLPWVQCAAKPECIAPPGASTGNHRFDQSALSIIAYKSGLDIQEHTELLLAEAVPCFKPHQRVVWTSRTGESCYAKHARCQEK